MSRVCYRQGARGCDINRLGAAREKNRLWWGKKKKSHFSSESSKFSYSPSYSSLPPKLRFPAGLTPWKSPSTHSFSGFNAPPVLMQCCGWLKVQGDSGPRVLRHSLPDTGDSPVSSITVHSGWEKMLPSRWASPLLSFSHCTQPMLKAASPSSPSPGSCSSPQICSSA